jgi:2-polyprenyl-3-methyl-5-hydroxy-6-metoxy-1,4-benzoquinol methylase
MTPLARLLVRGVDVVNRRGKAVGVRLVRLTGKRGYAIHPKHLVDHPWHDWYLPHLRADDRVLDVGCGNGAHLVQAARRCRTIVGMDYDVAHLVTGRRMAREAGVVNATLLAQDVTAPFPFAAETFDAVLFLDVIEHVHPRIEVLTEIRRVLKDGGRLLVSAPNRDTRWRRTLRAAGLFAYSDPDHKIEYTRDEFVAELRRGGFELDGPLEPVVHDTPWAGVIDAVGGVSLRAYDRLSRWRRQAALRNPGESTGFRARAWKIAR